MRSVWLGSGSISPRRPGADEFDQLPSHYPIDFRVAESYDHFEGDSPMATSTTSFWHGIRTLVLFVLALSLAVVLSSCGL